MSWDIIILNSKDTLSISKVDKFSLPSFGLRREIINTLTGLFPQIHWDDDLAYGHLENEEYFGNIALGDDDKMPGHFWLGIYGGTNPLKFIMTLCKTFNCSAFDTVTSEYITIDNPSDNGWTHFKDFKNYVSKTVAKNDNNNSLDK